MRRALVGCWMSLLVTSCGGGGEPSLETFDTPEAVLKAAVVTDLGGYLPWFDFARSGSGQPPACARSVTECNEGGTVRQRDVEIEVDSPYSDEPFIVSKTTYRQCVVHSGCFFREDTRINGTVRRGCPASEWNSRRCEDFFGSLFSDVSYSSEGTDAAPYSYRWSTTDRGRTVSMTRRARSEVHSWRGSESLAAEARTISRVETLYEVDGEIARRSVKRLGAPGQPYRTTSRRVGDDRTASTFDGHVALEREGCNLGAFTVRTLEPVELIGQSFVVNPRAVAGKLQLIGAGRRQGTVTIRPGELEVRDAHGRTKTFPFDPDALRAATGDCAPQFYVDRGP